VVENQALKHPASPKNREQTQPKHSVVVTDDLYDFYAHVLFLKKAMVPHAISKSTTSFTAFDGAATYGDAFNVERTSV